MPGVDEIVRDIRALSASIDHPEHWRVVIPVDEYDDVTDQLETTHDPGTYFDGISLVWSNRHDEPRAECKTSLAEAVRKTPARGEDA